MTHTPNKSKAAAAVAAAAFLTSLTLSACGQRGELYLPEPDGEVVTRPTQTPSTPPAGEAPATPDAASDDTLDKQKPKTPPPSP